MQRSPFHVRYETPISVLPFVVGIGTVVPLWGTKAPPIFFATSAEVIALGAVAMALQGGFFRVTTAGHRVAPAIRAAVLIASGVGLAFAFGALIRGNAGEPHVAMTAGGLAMGVSAFTLNALLGGPDETATSDPG